MKRLIALSAGILLLTAAAQSDGRGGGGGGHGGHSGGSHSGSRHGATHHSGTHGSHKHTSSTHYRMTAPGARDSHGRLIRSEAEKRKFMRETGYSHGRPGYVVDHIVPLKRGGCDCPSNMQWQTVAAAKAKDRWE
jgi:hypothetical protein